jgi:hypothetical protein
MVKPERFSSENISEHSERDESPPRRRGPAVVVPPRIFFITTNDIFFNWITVLKNYSVDLLMRFSPRGLSAKGMDMAHVSYSDSILYPSSFSEYKVTMDRLLGLNLPLLHKILSRVSMGDKVTFECTLETLETKSPRAMMTVFSAAKFSKPTKQNPEAVQTELEKETTYVINLLEIEPYFVEPNPAEIGAEVTIGSDNFFTTINDIASLADLARLTINSEALIFKVEEDMGGMTQTLKSCTSAGLFQRCVIECAEGESYSLLLPLQFIIKLAPIAKLSPNLLITLSREKDGEPGPFKIKCSIINNRTKTECGLFLFFLAGHVDA